MAHPVQPLRHAAGQLRLPRAQHFAHGMNAAGQLGLRAQERVHPFALEAFGLAKPSQEAPDEPERSRHDQSFAEAHRALAESEQRRVEKAGEVSEAHGGAYAIRPTCTRSKGEHGALC